MNNRYDKILESAQKFLDDVDSDVFLNDFLRLQDEFEGSMTVDEYLESTDYESR